MSIFLRTFLTFWIATVLMVLISMGMVAMTHPQNRIQPFSLHLPGLRACVVNSLSAPDVSRASHIADQCGVISILDPTQGERLTPGGSELARSLAAEVGPGVPLSLRPFPDRTMVAFDTPVDNAHFIAVAVLPTRAIPPPPFFWWQFVVAMAVSALSCLLLTRHFVGPVRKLQHCTEAFGRGDLDARPDPVLLKRNDELGDLSKTIGQMAARISKLLSSQKNFLIQVSHELGSPLTRLNLALALARRKAGPALIPELDRIQQESAELNSMVQQLLRLARLESGLEWEGEESYSLRELMEEVCYDNQLIADQTGKQLLLLSSPSIQMWGYRELLKRALDNVLRNAVRFTPEGSRVAVNVESSPDGQTVLVQVRDGGEGVQHDKLDAIFEPFVRGSSERSGAGLGLAIAKRAVLANRGTIRAMNLREGGLLVEISLPCTPSDPVAVPQADAVETSSAE